MGTRMLNATLFSPTTELAFPTTSATQQKLDTDFPGRECGNRECDKATFTSTFNARKSASSLKPRKNRRLGRREPLASARGSWMCEIMKPLMKIKEGVKKRR